jgi:sugar/nucleoside kinase (ribokinase family)
MYHTLALNLSANNVSTCLRFFMADQLQILLIGIATLDLHLRNFRMPAIDDHAYLDDYQFSPGGSALNMAFSLVQLEAKVTLCTRLGNDFAGSFVRSFIERAGIQLLAAPSDFATGFSVISSLDDGRIALTHFEGANNQIAPADISTNLLTANQILHIGGAMSMKDLDGEPLTTLLKQARSRGKITSLHTSRNTDKKDLLLDSLPYLDFIFLNAKEAIEISGRTKVSDAARWLRDRGVNNVAITLGGDGSYVMSPDFYGRVEAQEIAAVDTTGCGDAFAAGFLAAVWRKKDPRECASWGNVLGGLCAQSKGPLPKSFNLATVQSLVARSLTKQATLS